MKALLLLAIGLTALLKAAKLPISQTRPAARSQARPKAKTTNYGAKADSLNGIPGHHFGESRSNFPELEARGYNDPEGYVSYSLRPNQEATGWFGKNAEQVSPTYWFYQDKFAALSTTARNEARRLLADEATYLFGPGQAKGVDFGQATYQWSGQRVLVELTDGHNETKLSISSKLIQVQLAANKLARQKAESAARAAKFKADNAPLDH